MSGALPAKEPGLPGAGEEKGTEKEAGTPQEQVASLVARAEALAVRPVPPVAAQRDGPEPLPIAPPPEHRVGLVLAGGAAKGAYQVGAVRRLAEAGVQLTAVAGTSIGALNAAVLASAPDLTAGADRLSEAWEWFTGRFGQGPFGPADGQDDEFTVQFGNLAPRLVRMLSRRGDLEQLVRTFVDVDALRSGIPCRVAVYPVEAPIPMIFFRLRAAQAGMQVLRRWMGFRSRMVELNELPEQEVVDTVLGSAALPLLFPPRSAGSGYYRDGFLGGDNTPIRALADVDHCDVVIVVHLAPGETLRKGDHEGLTLLQIRPAHPLVPAGPLGAVSGALDFSPSRYRTLHEQGYRDADALMERVNALLRSTAAIRHSERLMAERVQRLQDPPRSPARPEDSPATTYTQPP